MSNFIAIVGNHRMTWDEAPYGDPAWEIWCQGSNVAYMPRWDRCFEIHSIPKLVKLYEGDPVAWPIWEKRWGVMKSARQGIIYMHDVHPEVPQSVKLDKDHLVRKYGKQLLWIGRHIDGKPSRALRTRPPPFDATTCWQIAKAIEELAPKVRRGKTCWLGVWGVDMETAGEYIEQRAPVWFFLGLAAGKGIKLVLPEMADLLKSSALYGYEEESEFAAFAKEIKDECLRTEITMDEAISRGASKEEQDRLLGAFNTLKWIQRRVA